MMAAANRSSRCDACGDNVGLWQAGFTSECAHNFHLRCVSGSGACPVCAATWKDTPATAAAPPPATPFSFASTSMFGPASTAPANSSSTSTMTGLFGQQRPQEPANSPFSNFSQAPPASSTPPPSQPSDSERSLFGQKQATSNPFWLGPAAPAAQSSAPAAQSPPPPPPSSSCSVCSAAMGRGQATVTSECGHTFHLGCFSDSVCAACGARWREEVAVTLTPPCTICGGAMGRGKAATVTSECGHTFHLRCISGSVCPACGARWRDEVTVTLVNPSSSSYSPARPPTFSSPSFGLASSASSPAIRAPVPSSVPSFSAAHRPLFSTPSSAPPNPFPAPPMAPSTRSFATPISSFSPPLFSRSADSTSAPATPTSSPNFAPPGSYPLAQQPSLSAHANATGWSFGTTPSYS